MQRVFLVPGFFGFANLGDLRYFGHVQRVLASALPSASFHEVATRPTAALDARTTTLADAVRAHSGPDDDVHLVGHSSGGLDARLLATPGNRIGADVAGRIRSVVTVSTPHRGTPSAATFDTLAGRRVLRLLSLATMVTVRRGSLPLAASLALLARVRRLESALDEESGLIDDLFDNLLASLTPDRRDAIASFFRDVREDQGLLAQLVPERMRTFDLGTPDAPDVRYGSVVCRAHPPDLLGVVDAGLSPTAHVARGIHEVCHRLARADTLLDLPADARDVVARRWPDLQPADNDVMVPVASQPHGRILATADADHLDIIGHFAGPDLSPPHYDWLRTGSGFRDPAFERVWSSVARFLEGGESGPASVSDAGAR
ncbi:MAG: hypothetical protein H6734_09985 [Alphaproteobacteria bacterium]|nr:hypothetical protein [Alphaproteobacteria bacterium]